MRNAIVTAALGPCALLGALVGMSAPAFAADNGIYIGGSVGRSNVKVDDIPGLNSEDFKGDDTGFKFIVGIRPLDWLAVEANYIDFGSPRDTVAGTQVKANGDGITASVIGFLPIGPVDFFARAGLISLNTDLEGELSADGTDLTYGVGAQFRVWSISVRAEYEKFDADKLDDLSMFSIGATYTFL